LVSVILKYDAFPKLESGKSKKEEKKLDKKKLAVKIQLPKKVCLVTKNCQEYAVERSFNKGFSCP
jgi:hypothetical protein